MLTRLRVRNFKNFEDVDVRFGPFTCIAGPNGSGKSNLFDAILFLGALGTTTLVAAAQRIRGVEARGDVRSLFRRVGDQQANRMSFLAEMIIPLVGVDEFGQQATAAATLVRYELELGWRIHPESSGPQLEVIREDLRHIRKEDARSSLIFPHRATWRNSVVKGRKTAAFISTNGEKITLHSDSGKSGGHVRHVPAKNLPRTVLAGATNAEEHRTLTLVRQEMASWTHLQLEPSALRKADDIGGPVQLAANGEHLPSALLHLSQVKGKDIFAQVANELSHLLESVNSIHVDRDVARNNLSIVLTDQQGTKHVASSLSDGTLRFLALTVLKNTPQGHQLLCMEEPENGIHPQRIGPMVQLLKDLAVDADEPVDETNPLRQVIINTHSPLVVNEVGDEILFVQPHEEFSQGVRTQHTLLACLPGTWRAQLAGTPTLSKGAMKRYLEPTGERQGWLYRRSEEP